jgi:hypothetical protein
MRYSAYEIERTLSSNFSKIEFLENIKKMEQRYSENSIIIFRYLENNTKTVIKSYSLENVQDKQINKRI